MYRDLTGPLDEGEWRVSFNSETGLGYISMTSGNGEILIEVPRGATETDRDNLAQLAGAIQWLESMVRQFALRSARILTRKRRRGLADSQKEGTARQEALALLKRGKSLAETGRRLRRTRERIRQFRNEALAAGEDLPPLIGPGPARSGSLPEGAQRPRRRLIQSTPRRLRAWIHGSVWVTREGEAAQELVAQSHVASGTLNGAAVEVHGKLTIGQAAKLFECAKSTLDQIMGGAAGPSLALASRIYAVTAATGGDALRPEDWVIQSDTDTGG